MLQKLPVCYHFFFHHDSTSISRSSFVILRNVEIFENSFKFTSFRRNFRQNSDLLSRLRKITFPSHFQSLVRHFHKSFRFPNSASFFRDFVPFTSFYRVCTAKKLEKRKLNFFQFHFLVSTNCLILRRIDGSSAIKF